MSAAPRVAKASFRMALYAGVGLAQRSLSLLLLPFVTRSMPVVEYGEVAVLASGAALAAVLIGGAIEQAVFRWSVREQQDAMTQSALRVGYIWLFRLAPVATCLAGVALALIPGRLLQVPLTLWGMELAAAALSAPLAYFLLPQARAQGRTGVYIAAGTLSIAVTLIGKVLLVLVFRLGPFGWAMSDLIAAAVGLVLARVLVRIPVGRPELGSVRVLLRFSGPLLPHVLSFWCLSSLNRPLLATSLPLHQVGIFAAAYSAASVSLIVLAEVNRALTPEYARLRATSEDRGPLRRLANTQLSAAALASGAMVLLAPAYGAVIAPASYVGVVPTTVALCLTPLAYGVYLVAANTLIQTAGRSGGIWRASGTAAVIILALSIPGGMLIGAPGVALVQDLAYGAMAAVAYAQVRRTSEVQVRTIMPRPALASLAVIGLAILIVAALVAGGTVMVLGLLLGTAALGAAVAIQLRATWRLT